MNEFEVSQRIIATFTGVDVAVASGDSFFFYNPDTNVPPVFIEEAGFPQLQVCGKPASSMSLLYLQ